MQQTDMHELRKDPLLGRWVAVLNDSKPPSAYSLFPENESKEACLFCAGRENELPAEIMSIPNQYPDRPSKKWWTRVVPNLSPVFRVEGDLGRRGEGCMTR